MLFFKESEFIRNMYAGDYLEIFLISSITGLLITRFLVSITGYPQIGGANLHIAHMLWGGFLMMTSVVMLLAFLGNRVLWAGAIIGGVGFGVFLDELGKFVTRDNNYLFQPTIAIIYIIFLLLFFVFRYIDEHSKYTQKEYLMNSLRILEEAVLNDLDKAEKRLFSQLLKKADPNDEVTIQLKNLLNELDAIPTKPSRLRKMYKTFSRYYNQLTESPLFPKGIILFFIIKMVADIFSVIYFLSNYMADPASLIRSTPTPLIIATFGQIFSTAIAALYVLFGVGTLRFSRNQAYFFFKQSLLVTIFFTQFFLFYKEQFHALSGLLFNILLLIGIDYMMTEERKIRLDKE